MIEFIENYKNILVIDKHPKYINALETHFLPLEYKFIPINNGNEALGILNKLKIELVILDTLIHDIDAYEILKYIKNNNPNFLPVIFITPSDHKHKKLLSIEAGADDFISKPIDIPELIAKIKSILRTKLLHDKLNENCTQLQTLQKFKDELSGMITHDINNLLTAISGNLTLMSMDKQTLPEMFRESIEGATNATHDLISLVSDFMDITKLEENKLKPMLTNTNVNEIIHHTTDNLKSITKDINIIKPDKKEELFFEIDVNLISRVITNLIINAIKFTPKEGSITIRSYIDNDNLWISIKDSGSGIPDEYKKKIFDKFTQVEMKQQNLKRGRGLGLTFCKLAVESHNGKIWVESEGKDKGSEFVFIIPKNTGGYNENKINSTKKESN